MKKDLQSIAMQLSETEIQELMRFKKVGDKKLVALNKKRDKLASQLADVDAAIAEITGGGEPEKKPRRPGRKSGKPGRPAKSTQSAKSAKPATPAAPARKKRQKRGGRVTLSMAVREVFSQAGTPLKARDVVDGLPATGFKVRDISAMRKRISVVLASQKNHFEQVERGVYQLKD